MGKKVLPEDKVIVAKAKEQFGDRCKAIANAVFLKDVAYALRNLMRDTAVASPATCDEALAFSEQYNLVGMK